MQIVISNVDLNRLSPVPLDLFAMDAIFGKNRMASNTAVPMIVTTVHLMFIRKMVMLFVNVGIECILQNYNSNSNRWKIVVQFQLLFTNKFDYALIVLCKH